jgi:hypothetical protein
MQVFQFRIGFDSEAFFKEERFDQHQKRIADFRFVQEVTFAQNYAGRFPVVGIVKLGEELLGPLISKRLFYFLVEKRGMKIISLE